MERARHPGLGEPAARALPPEVLRPLAVAVGGARGRAGGGARATAPAGPGPAGVPQLPRTMGTGPVTADHAQRSHRGAAGFPRHVLDAAAAARPRDRG